MDYALDILFNNLMHNLETPLLTKIAIAITTIGNAQFLAPLCILLILFLVYKKRYHPAFHTFGILSSAILTSEILKMSFSRIRPPNSLILESDPSFPSGHALMATVFFIWLIYLFKDEIKNKALRYTFVIACSLLAFLISFSRLYLNVHWFTDVFGGFILGVFWLIIFMLLDKKEHKEIKSKRHK